MSNNRIVNIFAGFKTTRNHYRNIINLYEKNNYKIHFHENTLINMMSPAKYNKKVLNILEKNGNNSDIIHSNSAGFWTALEYKNYVKNKLFIVDSGPYDINHIVFLNTIEKLFNVKIPIYIKNNSEDILSLLGLPVKNEEWKAVYYKNLKNLDNSIFFTSKKDAVVDINWIKKNLIVNNNRHFIFEEGTHYDMIKTNNNKYLEILQKELNLIHL